MEVSTCIIALNRIIELFSMHARIYGMKDGCDKHNSDGHYVQRSFFFNDIGSSVSRCVSRPTYV